jgi:hypothetical protein
MCEPLKFTSLTPKNKKKLSAKWTALDEFKLGVGPSPEQMKEIREDYKKQKRSK